MNALKSVSGFDWDEGNVNKNWIKHKVKNTECEQVFFNKPFSIFPDKSHSSKKEKRFFILGKTKRNRKLFISFTIRNKKVRVISARDQNKRERKKYEQI